MKVKSEKLHGQDFGLIICATVILCTLCIYISMKYMEALCLACKKLYYISNEPQLISAVFKQALIPGQAHCLLHADLIDALANSV